jgi:dTMP kinase
MAGYLISFEGIDGSGKTTQIQMLADWLKEQKIPYITTLEPGGTPLGYHLRELLLHTNKPVSLLAESYLYQADRAEHFEVVVLPALQRGEIVLTDRCLDSSYVYQFEVGEEFIRHLNGKSVQKRYPDLTFFLDIDPPTAMQRVENRVRRDISDEFFLMRVQRRDHLRMRYFQAAYQNKERFKTIDANNSIEYIHSEIKHHLNELLK